MSRLNTPNRGKPAGGRITGKLRNQINLWENISDTTNTVATRFTTSKSNSATNENDSQSKDAKSFPSTLGELSTEMSSPVIFRDKSP